MKEPYRPKDCFYDTRHDAYCFYCGGLLTQQTRDHLPPKIFLDKPYPHNLEMMPSCKECNEDTAKDEQYLAALVDCVVVGSATPSPEHRPKIRNALRARRLDLLPLLQEAKCEVESGPAFTADTERVHRVIIKLAKGHWRFQNAEVLEATDGMLRAWASPFITMTEDLRTAFEAPFSGGILPEVGSRQFIKAAMACQPGVQGWHIVQEGRYRYMAGYGPDGATVRIVFSEYLAAEVVWER